MKTIETPRTGKIGDKVAYLSIYGQCYRALVIPRNPRTLRQSRVRANLGAASRGWGLGLSEEQCQRWQQAAQTVPSWPSLGLYAALSGHQFHIKINSTLRLVGQAPVAEPPAPVVFGPDPVTGLTIDYDEAGNLRLRVTVGVAAEDIMLFAQEPCSAGRMKHRRVYYLRLLGLATDGPCDITAAYTGRFGQPRPGQKIFIVTNQHKNGWKGPDHVLSARVPPPPLPSQSPQTSAPQPQSAPTPSAPPSQPASLRVISSLPRSVYKRSTPDAQEIAWCAPREQLVCSSCTHSEDGAGQARDAGDGPGAGMKPKVNW
jgi:hypothetical protein